MEKTAISVKILKTELSKIKDNALLLGFFKDKLSLSPELKELDKSFGNIISSYIKSKSFKGEKGDAKMLFTNRSVKNIVLVGLGEQEKYSLDILSNTVADVSKKLKSEESFSILLDSFKSKFAEEDAVEKIALSCLLGLYKFTDYKTKDKENEKKRHITIISSSKNFEEQIKFASVAADAVSKTRDVVNTPPNIATPEYIAAYAKELAKKAKLKCTIFDEKQIEKMKMECFIAVAKGSINKPRMVVVEYNGAGRKKQIAIVGKGITFDSGGLNLKPYPFMSNMKDDKGGAIAAMHVVEACSILKLPVNVVAIMPFCENMPSGNSFRPDDILKAYNGMTVEIKNTDAEGRLILADALAYTAELKPKAIIDIASLTGASFIALGFVGTPFLGTDKKLNERLKEASKKSLEKLWEFPLWQEYEEQLKSDVADLKHIGDEGEAGVITGAVFLKNFVNEVPWAHIDIGTTVWSKVDKGVLAKGATGATVRLLIEMLRDWKN